MASFSESQAMDRNCDVDAGANAGFGDERNGWREEWSYSGQSADGIAGHAASGALLLKVIEAEIIPRLLLAHRGPPPALETKLALQGKFAAIGDLDTFARLVLTSEPGEIVDRVLVLLEGGIKIERIFIDLLAPAARLLGIYWKEDRCSFAEVTLALSSLHKVVHELGQRCRTDMVKPDLVRRAFFAPSPGEQHTLGLSMLEEMFHLAGWEASCDHGATAGSIVRKLSRDHTDIVGFSVSCENLVLPLTDLIVQTRKVSRNREIIVMVGGRFATDHPDIAATVGADAVICCGDDVVTLAENLVRDAFHSCGKRTLM